MNDQEKVPGSLDSGSAIQGSKADESSSAPEARGVSFDNIPPLTSKDGQSDRELCCGGEDTVKLSLWLSFNPFEFYELSVKLDKLKSDAQDTGKESCIVIGDTPWQVQKTGVHLGKNSRGSPYYRWQLRSGGIRFSLANRATASRLLGAPNAWIEFGSELLMVSGGLKFVYPPLLKTLEAMHAQLNAHTVSEMHVCVDLPEYPISEFLEKWHARHWVSRAKRRTTYETSGGVDLESSTHGYGLRPTGFDFGSTITLCVYEKRWEVRDCPSKLAIMEKVRWGGPMHSAVRVEFKMRRETLKSRNIHTVDDWEREKGGLVRWLSEDWFRMTEGDVDRTNTSRTATWATWRLVQAMFVSCVGDGQKPPEREHSIQLNPKALVQQSIGCLAKAMAYYGMAPTNLAEFLDGSARLLTCHADMDEVRAKIKENVEELAACSPTKWFVKWYGSSLLGGWVRKLREIAKRGGEEDGGATNSGV